ncbi:MAG: hypothetical protein QOE31_2720 [Solirubrobacteraceae bacterium]|nr:hypothetical protein [Solirubrobacteraceae bacterium]
MSERADAHDRGRRVDAQVTLLVVSALLTCAGLALSDQAAALALSAAQTAALGSLLGRALRSCFGWRSVEFVVVASWLVLFTVPCWLYALDPGLLDQGTPARAALLVNIALYGYALGLMLWRPTGPTVHGTLEVARMRPRTRVLIGWWLVGFAAFALLLLRHGNPLHYLSRLDESASLNLGAFYIVALALMMRFSVLVWAAGRWSRGEPLEPLAIALAVAGTVLIGLTGSRLFVAVALIDFVLLYALLRRPLPLRRIAPYGLAIGLVIVFGLGTIKRFQSYNTSHPGSQIAFTHYATHNAPSELATAYANNYVDTVRLIAIADRLVPRSADWEGPRALLELAVKPLPRPVRPTIGRQQVLRAAFEPNEDYAYAMPLFGTAFLAGGIVVLALVSIGVGAFVGVLDRRLASQTLTVGTVAVLVAVAVGVPSLLRGGVPAGATLLLVDGVGTWVVARTGLRRG